MPAIQSRSVCFLGISEAEGLTHEDPLPSVVVVPDPKYLEIVPPGQKETKLDSAGLGKDERTELALTSCG